MPRVYNRDLPPDHDDIAVSAVVERLLATGFEEADQPFVVGDRVVVDFEKIEIDHFHNGLDDVLPTEKIGTRTVRRIGYIRDLLVTRNYVENIGWVMELDGFQKPNLFRPEVMSRPR